MFTFGGSNVMLWCSCLEMMQKGQGRVWGVLNNNKGRRDGGGKDALRVLLHAAKA